MIQYPKEYEEAISRLNAPERSPLPYAPIPYGPVPNHCNYMNWNRIMAETRQGVLPKYSILQRIDLGSQNDLVNVSDAKEYTYTLDPSFTFAKGTRKSIAVRAVDIYNVIPNGQTVTASEKFTGSFKLTYYDGDNLDSNGKASYYRTIVTLADLSFICSNDLPVSMANFAEAFGKMLLTQFNAASTRNDVISEYFSQEYDSANRTVSVTITPAPSRNITFDAISSEAGTLPTWVIQQSNILDYYNAPASVTEIVINGQLQQSALKLSIQLPADVLDIRSAGICGTINPWTKNNLIAPLTYSSDTLTKVFPWNGCTEARFWFINDKGEKVRWRVVRGYIDLELIIDNTDSYAMDAH